PLPSLRIHGERRPLCKHRARTAVRMAPLLGGSDRRLGRDLSVGRPVVLYVADVMLPSRRIDLAVTVGHSCEKLFLVNVPETLYVKPSAGRIAYRVVGTGPPDVLVTRPGFVAVDLMWEEPRSVRFLNGLSSFSRHIWFDRRGIGASDSIAPVGR